jgi:hypothetical protein
VLHGNAHHSDTGFTGLSKKRLMTWNQGSDYPYGGVIEFTGRRAMTYEQIQVSGWSAMDAIHATLLAFPIACFSLTVVTDAAYWWTENLLWLHFSEWLLLAGLLIGAIELLVRIIEVPSAR